MGLRLSFHRFHAGLVALALLCLWFGDWQVYQHDPSQVLARMAGGLLTPTLDGIEQPLNALAGTMAFALLGVMGAWALGLLLAMAYHHRAVRVLCASARGVHELFWALLFLQVFGLHPLTGLLAILIPYAGICARVYAELIEETPDRAERSLQHAGRFSRYTWTRLAQAWPHIRAYSGYRMECGLRSSAVLGFVGLPTLGYHLESAFRQGHYPQAFALLYLFFVLIGTRHWWLRPQLLPLYAIAAVLWLPGAPAIDGGLVWQFLRYEIWPQSLLDGDLGRFAQWTGALLVQEGLPGIANTLALSVVALLLTLVFALLQYPWISRHFVTARWRWFGHGVLVVLRATPEYVLAYIGLIVLGPSMLPGALALSIHNGAIIAFLTGQASNSLALRADAPRHAINRYFWSVLPRVYRTLLAFTLYRFEIILRESAILGILGIYTLGFYIDSAFEDIRFDKAIMLIAMTALMNIAAEGVARRLRQALALRNTPEEL